MSSIRITGLATGIDTDQMIKDMMKVERTRVDRAQQDKQILQWRQELYNSINKDFANFILNTKKEFGLMTTTSTGVMFNKSLSSLSWVKKAVSSDESAVKVSTTSEAINGSYEIIVERLADGVKGVSGASISIGDKANLASQFNLGENDTIEFSIVSGDKAINFAFGKDVILGEGTVGISGKKLSEIKMSDIVKVINSATTADEKKLGVQASYDANIDRFFIQTTATGKDATLKIEATDGSVGKNFIDALKLNITSYDPTSGNLKPVSALVTGETYNGVNALLSFNGATGIEQSSNQFTINGINFDIEQADLSSTITVTVDTDTDAAYDKIKGFIDKYNEMVDKMGELLGEKQYRDFRPLTAEQKEAMKEKEIELWEEKAKSGLLRNDSIISSTMQKVRSSLYEKVQGIEGPFSALYEIGIETERWVAGATGGRLKKDEEELKKAIAEDVNGVLELLFKEAGPVSATDADGNLIPGETVEGKGGVITRMYDIMIDGMKEVINKAGIGEEASLFRSIRSNMLIDFVTEYGSISMLEKDMSKLDLRIDDLNRYLASKESQYYNQFAAMEKYIQQMNNQSSWMMQQFGMGN